MYFFSTRDQLSELNIEFRYFKITSTIPYRLKFNTKNLNLVILTRSGVEQYKSVHGFVNIGQQNNMEKYYLLEHLQWYKPTITSLLTSLMFISFVHK